MIPSNENFRNFERLFNCFIVASVNHPYIIQDVCNLIRSSYYDDSIKDQLLDLYASQCADVVIDSDIDKFFKENEV